MVGKQDLLVGSFDGTDLTLTTSIELGTFVFGVGWRPGGTELAVGTLLGAERLRLYDYDNQGASLTEITTARTTENKMVFGLSWNPAGTSLAVSRSIDTNGFEVKLLVQEILLV